MITKNSYRHKGPSQLDYEEHLNDFYNQQDDDDVIAQLEYLTTPSKVSKFAQPARLKSSIRNGHAGAMLRKYDVTAFNVGYSSYVANY